MPPKGEQRFIWRISEKASRKVSRSVRGFHMLIFDRMGGERAPEPRISRDQAVVGGWEIAIRIWNLPVYKYEDNRYTK